MSLGRICGVEWGSLEVVLGDGRGRVGMQNLILVSRSQLWSIQSPNVSLTYPANIGVQEPPPYSVFSDLFHPATPVQEHGQHALS